MNKKNYHFYIFTGGIKTGKSTSLLKWSATITSIGGIVQLQKEEKRRIVDLSTNESKELTVQEKNNSVKVGKYLFDKSVIHWGEGILLNALENKVDWLIFDEYGICELSGECFEPFISELINKIRINNLEVNFLIVVRETLREKLIEKFGAEENLTIIHTLSELSTQ